MPKRLLKSSIEINIGDLTKKLEKTKPSSKGLSDENSDKESNHSEESSDDVNQRTHP